MIKRRKALLSLLLLLGVSNLPGAMRAGEEGALTRSQVLPSHVRQQAGVMGAAIEEIKQWARIYGEAETYETAYSIVQTVDGGYVFTGAIGSQPNLEAWLVKLNVRGKVEWIRTYDGPPALVVLQTADGGFAITGSLGGGFSTQAGSDVWLGKTDARGEVQWTQTYDWQARDIVDTLLQTSDEGFILGGSSSPGPGEGEIQSDGWLVKTDAAGTLEWTRVYRGPNDDHVDAVVQTTDGGFALAGYTDSSGAGEWDFWLVRTDVYGEMEWQRTYGGSKHDNAYAVSQTVDGGFALVGRTDSYGAGGTDVWLVKTDAQGILQWNRTYGGIAHDAAYSGIQTADGGFVLTGYTNSYGAGGTDAWLVKTDPHGVVQWNRTYGGTESDRAFSIIQTADRGYAFAGHTRSYGVGEVDAWVVKTDAHGVAPDPESDRSSFKVIVLGGSGGLALLVTIIVGRWLRKKRRS